MRVVGVDGCKKGWIAVVLNSGLFETAVYERGIAGVVKRFSDCGVIAIDIPIGAEVGRFRRVDSAAREFIGPLGSSVFEMPPAGVLDQPTHKDAVLLAQKLAGKGLSAQSYALGAKVREVAAVVSSDNAIIEVHPEVSFCQLRGSHLPASKKTWAGHLLRRTLLDRAGIQVPADIGEAGRQAGVDDVLDAAVAAWSAHRHATGISQHLEPSSREENGRLVTIWY